MAHICKVSVRVCERILDFLERSALTAECYLVTTHARKPAMSASRIKVLPAT